MSKFLCVAIAACCVFGVAISQPAGANIDCNNPPTSNPDTCCKTPLFFTDTMVGNCESNIQSKTTNTTVTAECIANCLLKTNNALNTDGSVKKDALASFFIKQTKDSVWNPAITKAVGACVADGAKRAAEFAKIAAGAPCGPMPLFTVDCVFMQLFKACPTERWSRNDNCATLKNYVNKCSLV